MTTSVLIDIFATADPTTHAAIVEAAHQRCEENNRPIHEVWTKRYSGTMGIDDLCLGSYRVVGGADRIHDSYPIETNRDLLRAVADQTRRRVLAAGATKCVVTVHDVEEAPSITLSTDGTEDC